MGIIITLFFAGALTILLPCILPLVPIVVGASIAGKNRLLPLMVTLGMVISFVGSTFLLVLLLSSFVQLADYIRIATYAILLLFGLGFFTHRPAIRYIGAAAAGLFFLGKGPIAVVATGTIGMLCMFIGGEIASRIQTFGSRTQQAARAGLGQDSLLAGFIIGLTIGMVWVPCAGPALGFAFALVREQPGLQAFFALTAYGVGAALPLLLIGYGGQRAVASARSLNAYTGIVERVAGAVLILTAFALQYGWLVALQTWIVQYTSYGIIGTQIEESLFGDDLRGTPIVPAVQSSSSSSFSSASLAATSEFSSSAASTSASVQSSLPVIAKSPELTGLGTWHNSTALTLEQLRGKVVLIDFWTYSCINCIRTLPYLKDWWKKYGGDTVQDSPFVIIGVHTPEFVFEQDDSNVQEAVERQGITYPIVQDNKYATWRAFNNRYWPAKYLIDAQGNIRYMHFGEGKYEETEEAIQSLLREAGLDMAEKPTTTVASENGGRNVSPETYLGARSWSAFGNGKSIPTDDQLSYTFPTAFTLNKYYLEGDWQLVDQERQVLRSKEGKIVLRFVGSEVNLVLGVEEGGASFVQARAWIDGVQMRDFTFSFHNLYTLFKGQYGEHTLLLELQGAGAEAYAFTFGS